MARGLGPRLWTHPNLLQTIQQTREIILVPHALSDPRMQNRCPFGWRMAPEKHHQPKSRLVTGLVLWTGHPHRSQWNYTVRRGQRLQDLAQWTGSMLLPPSEVDTSGHQSWDHIPDQRFLI